MLLWQKLNSRVFVCTLWLLWRMKNGDPLRARQTDRERGGESRKVMNLVLISTSPKESGCTYQGGPMLRGHFIYVRKVDRNSFRLLYMRVITPYVNRCAGQGITLLQKF